MTKLSGVMPASELRAGWQVSRVSDMAILVNGYPFPSELFSSDGEVPLVRIRDVTASSFETFIPRDHVPRTAWIEKNDLLIGMDGDFNTALWTRGPAALNQRVCLLRPRANNDIRFIAYAIPDLLKTVNDLTYATTVKHLSSGDVNALRVPKPDIDTQRRIADYLDEQTAKIDLLIGKQERLIETLAERRQAVISHAVTKGLDPSVSMKESGVEWLAEVPNHWSVVPLKSLASIIGRIGFRGYTTEDIVSPDEGAITLSPSNLVASTLSLENSTYISWEKYAESPEIILRPGDIVVVKTGSSMGKLAMANHDSATAITINPQLAIVRPKRHAAYMLYSLSTQRVLSEFRSRNAGGSIPTMTQKTIGNVQIALPPRNEQSAIVRYLQDEISRIDALSAKARGMIDVLKERRRALISSAVTGKIDVRGLS